MRTTERLGSTVSSRDRCAMLQTYACLVYDIKKRAARYMA